MGRKGPFYTHPVGHVDVEICAIYYFFIKKRELGFPLHARAPATAVAETEIWTMLVLFQKKNEYFSRPETTDPPPLSAF